MKRMINKTLALWVSVFALIMFASANLSACEIEFKILKGEKEKYNKGDQIIVKVTVILTHRNCPEGIDATKFNTKGLKIEKATRWEEKSTGIFERKMMLKVTDNKKDINITGIRTCDKEGGFGALVLSTK